MRSTQTYELTFFFANCNWRHVQGICDLVADKMKQMHGLDVDPLTDIAICCGQTEAFAATMFASMSTENFPNNPLILIQKHE